MVSYCIAHKDRLNLLSVNLLSLTLQTDKDFEIIIVDNSQDTSGIKEMIDSYRSKGLKIKCVTIDPSKNKHIYPGYNGFCNPALSQNIAAKLSSGSILVLTSPEVVNSKNNVKNIRNYFSNDLNDCSFLYGWVDEREVEIVKPIVENGIDEISIKQICKISYKMAKCRPEAWNRNSYFIGSIKKKLFYELGGIDERFMAGRGFEDDDFVRRLEMKNAKFELSENVAGIHLCHERGYLYQINDNRQLYYSLKQSRTSTANQNEDWGSPECIIREY